MLQMDLHKAYDMVKWSALKTIIQEISFPSTFTSWIMTAITTISYKYKINGMHTRILKARRRLMQWDPLSLLLFVILMEYLHISLHKLRKNANFNFYSKFEKLNIINLSFEDDLLLFSRGDVISIELMLKAFNNFSESIGLSVNPVKCKAYFGRVDTTTK